MKQTPFSQVLAHFKAADPLVYQALRTVNLTDWFESRVTKDYYWHLTKNIIGQQLSGKAADTIITRCQKLVGDVLEPQVVLNIPDQSLRDAGLSWAKVKYVKDLAAKVIAGEVVLDHLDTRSDEEVIAELTKVKGIGRWTAEMFLLFTLGREDIFSYGDLGLKKGFAKLYGHAMPTEADIAPVIARWSPYKSYGSIVLWHTLDNRERTIQESK